MKRILVILLTITSCLTSPLLCSGMVLPKGGYNVVISSTEDAPVKIAAGHLLRDFQSVTGSTPDLINTIPDGDAVNIVIVNASSSRPVVAPVILKELDGFESHRVYADAKSRRIYLYGKDMRGTIYAIYTFSEKVLGVPPLWFYSFWKPEKKKIIKVSDEMDYFFKSPQVRFRAWFPNDMDLFRPWHKISNTNDKSWYEAMLRLKLNTVELEATVTYPDYKVRQDAVFLKRYGLIQTSHHHVVCNNNFKNWAGYWEQVKHTEVPELLLANEDKMIEFWRYSIETVVKNDMENLWQVGFRGIGDQPFWAAIKDAPEDDQSRAEVINKMIRIQYELIREITGEDKPFVRMTFYDEISDLLAKGYLKPIVADNVLWTFVAGRRDHYPYDDLVNFNPEIPVNLGYYMNLQFTSTGAHLAAAEGPWKTEQNYRYVNSKKPLLFSVVNVGNFREFVMEMSANAKMMWDFESYDTDSFLRSYCEQYFGSQHAEEIARLYHDYYYSYWQQKPSEFPGMDRQFIFQDNRYARVFNQMEKPFASNQYDPNPLREIGYERIKGRTFRIDGESQVDSIIVGTRRAAADFKNVAARAEVINKKLDKKCRPFFYDNLMAPCIYMSELSESLSLFMEAYKNSVPEERKMLIEDSEVHLKQARAALFATQRGVYDTWYEGESVIGFDKIIASMEKIKESCR